jgi:hypothetical protein
MRYPPKPTSKVSDAIILPGDIIESDTVYPKYTRNNPHPVVAQFTMDYTKQFGWCIRTLGIRRARRAGRTDRTYAIRVDTKSPVRIGAGPHVLRTVTVYVTQKRQPKLQRFLDMQTLGEEQAGTIRDRISSRRAQGALMRAEGRRSWRWDT